jgi:predicted TPR repeat methyltransferase/predicted negative regulator of RcsB-dependent stress response
MKQSDQLAQAVAAHQQGDINHALAQYTCYLNTYSTCASGHHFLGVLYAQQHQWDDAINTLQQAITIEPNNPYFHNSLGNAYKGNKDFACAKEHYQTAILHQPSYASAYNNLGTIAQQHNDIDQAKSYYGQAIHHDPHYPEPHYNLALCAIAQQQWDQAAKLCATTIKLNPDHPKAHLQLGSVCLQQQNSKQAKCHFEQQLAFDPNCTMSQFNLGLIAVESADHSLAVSHFEAAIAIQPDHIEANFNAAACYMHMGHYTKALPHYLFILQKHEDIEAIYNIGIIYLAQDRHQQAIAYFEQVLAKDSQHLAGRVNLANALLKHNDHKRAIEQYEILLQQCPNNEQFKFTLAGLKQKNIPATPPNTFVSELFNAYAPHYDTHLSQHLHYDAPQQLCQAYINEALPEKASLRVLDLGCGTGLCGQIFKPYAQEIIGIDLATDMISIAATKGIYNALHVMSITDALKQFGPFDLILAADVFPYVGQLDHVLSAIKSALSPNGHVAFTCEKSTQTKTFDLQKTLRYSHHRQYINDMLTQAKLEVRTFENCILRQQNGKPLNGHLIIATT